MYGLGERSSGLALIGKWLHIELLVFLMVHSSERSERATVEGDQRVDYIQ